MSTREERIIEIRGRNRYEDGLQDLRVVSNGAREGAITSFRTRAQRLLALEQNLPDERRARIRSLLATDRVGSMEDALLFIEKESEEKD